MQMLRSRTVYADRWMSLRQDTVRRPDGSTGTYAVVDTPDIALIVPVDGHRLHLVEQYRHAVGSRTWEFPSGAVAPDLDAAAEDAAQRELLEETGLLAATLTPLGVLHVAPSLINHMCHVFLATDLTGGPPHRDREEQDMRSAWFTLPDVQRMIATGAITDARSIAALGLYLLPAHAAEHPVL